VLVFGSEHVYLEQMAVSASFEYRLSRRWTLSAAAGGVLGGRLDTNAGSTAMGGGGVGSLAASFIALEQGKYWPFIMLSGSASVSAVQAQPTTWVGVDARLGVAVGYTILQRVTPYLTGRVYGGPVLWRGEVGTDLFHWQAGLGVVVGLPWGLDLSAEVVPFGEKRITAGVGVSF